MEVFWEGCGRCFLSPRARSRRRSRMTLLGCSMDSKTGGDHFFLGLMGLAECWERGFLRVLLMVLVMMWMRWRRFCVVLFVQHSTVRHVVRWDECWM